MSALTKAYQDIFEQNPELTAVFKMDDRGGVQRSAQADEGIVTAATALMTPLREFLDRVTAELGCGELTACVVEGEHASFAIADVDGVDAVVMVGKKGCAIGSLRADALWLAQQERAAQ